MNRKIKLNVRVILLYVFMFMSLLYAFNSPIAYTIYGNNNNIIITTAIGIVGLFLFSKKDRISKKIVLVAAGIIIFLLMTLINSGYLMFGLELRVAIYSMYIVLLFVIFLSPETMQIFCNVLKIFIIEHMGVTLIGVFFKDYYTNNILSLVCENNVYCPAAGNYYHGYVPGLTSNFSMNAIYQSIAMCFLFSEYLSNKKKSTLLFTIIALVCLFVAGKRAHLIFSIFACIVLYFVSKKDSKLMNKILMFVVVGFIGLGAFLFLSKYIPELMNVVNRFTLLFEEGDLANGRSELYALAIMLWKQHMIFGNGWGAFAYNYPSYIINTEGAITNDAHNVYLQLLCEVGIVGALFIILLMIYFFVSAYKNILENNNLTKVEDVITKFAFSYQIFFLLYCFTGNPLYDHYCYVVYFIVIGYTLYIRFRSKDGINEKSRNNNVL